MYVSKFCDVSGLFTAQSSRFSSRNFRWNQPHPASYLMRAFLYYTEYPNWTRPGWEPRCINCRRLNRSTKARDAQQIIKDNSSSLIINLQELSRNWNEEFIFPQKWLSSIFQNDSLQLPGGGGVLPSNRLMGMCRWVGSHFHDWWGCNFISY